MPVSKDTSSERIVRTSLKQSFTGVRRTVSEHHGEVRDGTDLRLGGTGGGRSRRLRDELRVCSWWCYVGRWAGGGV
jgi:hypothetical protein